MGGSIMGALREHGGVGKKYYKVGWCRGTVGEGVWNDFLDSKFLENPAKEFASFSGTLIVCPHPDYTDHLARRLET